MQKNNQEDTVETVGAGLKKFLNSSKTERETISTAKKMLEEKGYVELTAGKKIKPGDRVYRVQMNKAIMAFNIGEDAIENGMSILAAHIDSPRIDLKSKPIYEDHGFVYFDTHYYGMPKQYQWKTTPLSMHGVIIKKDGTLQNVVIGEDPNDPILAITDLLPHMDDAAPEKSNPAKPDGEILDILVGGGNTPKSEKESCLQEFKQLLEEKYGINEKDFISAELEIVPAGDSRDYGLDRSMVMAYGLDDRVCAYAALEALLKTDNLKRTACCMLVDKEEVGSIGATGMQSRFFENVVAELVNAMGDYNDLSVRRALQNSYLISLDVTAAYDPLFASSFDERSAGYLGKGIALKKYCGVLGKYMSNDANAEYVAGLIRVFEDNNVLYQVPEMCKVDAGGGCTLTHYFAQYGMEAIDAGVPILCMHAPWEIASKTDVFETYKGLYAFLNNSCIIRQSL